MNFKNKRRWHIIRRYIISWTLAFIFLSIVRGEGTRELGSVDLEFWDSVIACFTMGPLFGLISGIAQVLTEEYGYKKISLQKLLFLRFIFAIIFVMSIIVLAYFIYAEDIGFIQFVFEPGSFAAYFYIVFVDIFLFCLRQVNLFFGKSKLFKILRGRYYDPREEERIFMFLDLKSSTEHAERLGHIQYSKMIQDCFNDLGVVIENDSEIYQYVGDEVILTWKLKEGLRNQNCIKAYFNFQQQLNNKKDYYMSNYKCQPFFKAGCNSGIVTVTEVGKYKKELAYHGDTINTAARIQDKCNEFEQQLLISERLKDKLIKSDFTFKRLGNVELKGKKRQVPIYAVLQTNK